MSAITETIAREYFERLGFLVSQPRKYVAPGRQRKAEEEYEKSDLLQVIRLLKNYGLVRDDQLDFFVAGRRRRKPES